MKLVLSIFKWFFVAIIGLFILLFAYANYTVYSFDTETMPEKYGEVEVKLFLSEGSNQPLVVGLGSADGGNGWAGPHGEKQRKLLQNNGYAFLSTAYFGTENIPKIQIESPLKVCTRR